MEDCGFGAMSEICSPNRRSRRILQGSSLRLCHEVDLAQFGKQRFLFQDSSLAGCMGSAHLASREVRGWVLVGLNPGIRSSNPIPISNTIQLFNLHIQTLQPSKGFR
jgi:hypothetical protein